MSLELISIEEDINVITNSIRLTELYIAKITKRYINPETEKHLTAIQKLRKERYELKKELLILKFKPCNG